MNEPIKYAILAICVVVGLWIVISNLGRVWKIICNSIFGMLALLLANLITTPFNFFVGVNGVTCLVCGILGIPGFIMLFLLKLII